MLNEFLDAMSKVHVLLIGAGGGAFLALLLWLIVYLIVHSVRALRKRRASRNRPPTAFESAREAFTDEEWERLYPALERESRRAGVRAAEKEDLESLRATMKLSPSLLDNPLSRDVCEDTVRLREASVALDVLWHYPEACAALLDPYALADTLLVAKAIEYLEDCPTVVSVREYTGALRVTLDTAPFPCDAFDWEAVLPYLKSACHSDRVYVNDTFSEGRVEIVVERHPPAGGRRSRPLQDS